MKPLCIYHGNCADGFGAAWVVWKHFKGEVDFHPGFYDKPPPGVTDRDVVIVDFSYPRDVLEAINIHARSLLVLDHHKSAREDLQVFTDISDWAPMGWQGHMENVRQDQMENAAPIYTWFDMDRSGAGITWDFFNPGKPRPRLIDHIEDRDLWRFNLEGTREIQACVFSFPYDFEVWDRLVEDAEHTDTRVEMIAAGIAIMRKQLKDTDELLAVATRKMKLNGEWIPCVNLPYTMGSEACHRLLETWSAPIAAYYFDKADERQFGLRSVVDGPDCQEIAKAYGGGGHVHSAGFELPHDQAHRVEIE